MRGSSNIEKAGKARSYGLYRHLRRNKEIIKNLFRYYLKTAATGEQKSAEAGCYFREERGAK